MKVVDKKWVKSLFENKFNNKIIFSIFISLRKLFPFYFNALSEFSEVNCVRITTAMNLGTTKNVIYFLFLLNVSGIFTIDDEIKYTRHTEGLVSRESQKKFKRNFR